MSIEKIKALLLTLVTLHQELIAISNQKTEAVKSGNLEKLQQVLVNERKQIRKIEKAEEGRQLVVADWFESQRLNIEPTITRLVEAINCDETRKELTAATNQLTEAITTLKQQEQLNMALINQSMQFIQLSMDLLNPSLSQMNYGRSETESTGSIKRSVFDSKA
ncbi:flagellar protein FlgN [Virgibacillus salexigens]|uniref:flagellar protein FlgN n=1 Tax=Virgibacillus salexigens TaxID=61016 RepID=UPI001F2F163F|nr:flagellar protein FlgN [Virgibacillus salexigens]